VARGHVSMKGRGREAFLPEPELEPAVAAEQIVLSVSEGQVVEFPIAQLWLDDQPRQIVPDAVLARLIADDQAHPPRLLEELKSVAGEHPYYQGVLEALRALARTIESDGVLEPLLVIKRPHGETERYVLRDGHRRSLGSLIAGRATVPVRVIDEPSDLYSTTRQFVVNIQRQDLTALEKGRWLFRLARLVELDLRRDQGLGEGPSVVEALVSQVDAVSHVRNGEADLRSGFGAGAESLDETPVSQVRNGRDGDGPVSHLRSGQPTETAVRSASADQRALAAAVRRRVCELTGLGQTPYYQLLYLNRLSPDAQEAGIGLAEGQLRPVTSLPQPDQPEIVRFIAARRLTGKEAASLVQVARSGDRDAVRRVMAKLAKEEVGHSRASVSWEGLLHALPKDLWARCASLRAELAALPSDRRDVRLRAMWEQRRLAVEFQRQFDEVFELYAFEGVAEVADASVVSEAEADS
jgi:hypothetical protein